jgi:hypothetical protein
LRPARKTRRVTTGKSFAHPASNQHVVTMTPGFRLFLLESAESPNGLGRKLRFALVSRLRSARSACLAVALLVFIAVNAVAAEPKLVLASHSFGNFETEDTFGDYLRRSRSAAIDREHPFRGWFQNHGTRRVGAATRSALSSPEAGRADATLSARLRRLFYGL